MLLSIVHAEIQGPRYLAMKTGEDVVFQWNSTNEILSVEWGLTNRTDITFHIIYHAFNSSPTLGPTVGNTIFQGRVSFVGNLTTGHAWFKISKLKICDSRYYGVLIRERRHVGTQLYWVRLVVGTLL